jgi:uncharacterized protein YukE
MRSPTPGSDAPEWTGRIDVDPGEIQAAAPGFASASDEVATGCQWVSVWADSAAAGLADSSAAAAWSRAMHLWTGDLGTLAKTLAQVAALLTDSGESYRRADQGAGTAYGLAP